MVRTQRFVQAMGRLETSEYISARAGKTIDDLFEKKAKYVADAIIKVIDREKIDEIKAMSPLLV